MFIGYLSGKFQLKHLGIPSLLSNQQTQTNADEKVWGREHLYSNSCGVLRTITIGVNMKVPQ